MHRMMLLYSNSVCPSVSYIQYCVKTAKCITAIIQHLTAPSRSSF